MKALTVKAPYSDAIMRGWKGYEIRGWAPKFRGDFVLHAGQAWAKDLDIATFYAVQDVTPDMVQRGAGLGIVRLLDVVPSDSLNLTAWERTLNPVQYGQWAWKLVVIEVWEKPVPAKGKLGFWNWSAK